MQIARANLARMADEHEAQAIVVLAQRLADELGDAGSVGIEALRTFVRARVKAGRALGLSSGRDLEAFVMLEFRSAGRFAADPEVRRELAQDDLPADLRVALVCARISPRAWLRIDPKSPPLRAPLGTRS